MTSDGSFPPTRARAVPPSIPAGERVYAIGDVHGRLDLLERLVGLIRRDNAGRPSARVRLILIGDIIDRGPDSAQVVERCMDMAKRTQRFVVLKGNHEAMMVDALAGDFLALSLWLASGGDAALSSWGVPDRLLTDEAAAELLRAAGERVPAGVRMWLANLPLTCRVGDYLFVHAGIRPGVEISRQSHDDLLWIRREFLECIEDHVQIVVHGHSIKEGGVDIQPNRIGIDTGAYRTGVLSALALEADMRWTLATDGPPSSG